MGGQNIERREALRIIGLASVAAGFPGFRKWAFACDHTPATSSGNFPDDSSYKPLFFSQHQYGLLTRIVDMIIPKDDSPGALDAGVPEFIDFMVASGVPVRQNREIRCAQDAIEAGNQAQLLYVAGLDWIDTRATVEFGKEFLACTPHQQQALLEELAYKEKFKPGSEAGREFFNFVRTYTVVGYYTSKIGLEALGDPGLRNVWPAMPACTHLDDPEHLRLPKREH